MALLTIVLMSTALSTMKHQGFALRVTSMYQGFSLAFTSFICRVKTKWPLVCDVIDQFVT